MTWAANSDCWANVDALDAQVGVYWDGATISDAIDAGALTESSAPMMTLDALKLHLGISDTSSDAALMRIGFEVSTLLRGYLGREVSYGVFTEMFFPPVRAPIYLTQAPVWAVLASSIDIIRRQRETGMLYFRAPVISDVVEITYVGGYLSLPADLASAYAAICSGRLTSGPAAAGGGLAAGSISSVTLHSVGQIQFATGQEGASGDEDLPYEIAPFAAIIDKYRNPRLVGIA